MTVPMDEIALNILRSFVLGLFFGAAYDCVRILRVLFGTSDYSKGSAVFARVYGRALRDFFPKASGRVYVSVFMAITDALFFTLCGTVFVLFLYCYNYGIFRALFMLAAVAGFWCYFNSVGRAVIFAAYEISQIVKLLINTILWIIFAPLRLLRSAVVRLYKITIYRLYKKTIYRIDKYKMKRYTDKCTDRLSEFVCFGDVK